MRLNNVPRYPFTKKKMNESSLDEETSQWTAISTIFGSDRLQTA